MRTPSPPPRFAEFSCDDHAPYRLYVDHCAKCRANRDGGVRQRGAEQQPQHERSAAESAALRSASLDRIYTTSERAATALTFVDAGPEADAAIRRGLAAYDAMPPHRQRALDTIVESGIDRFDQQSIARLDETRRVLLLAAIGRRVQKLHEQAGFIFATFVADARDAERRGAAGGN